MAINCPLFTFVVVQRDAPYKVVLDNFVCNNLSLLLLSVKLPLPNMSLIAGVFDGLILIFITKLVNCFVTTFCKYRATFDVCYYINNDIHFYLHVFVARTKFSGGKFLKIVQYALAEMAHQ